MVARVVGGVVVAIRVVVKNERDARELRDVVDALRELGDDMPWTECRELAERLDAITQRLTHVAAK